MTALAVGWCSFAASLDPSGPSGPDSLVELAVKAVQMLEVAHKAAAEATAKGQPAYDANNIGACLAGQRGIVDAQPGEFRN